MLIKKGMLCDISKFIKTRLLQIKLDPQQCNSQKLMDNCITSFQKFS